MVNLERLGVCVNPHCGRQDEDPRGKHCCDCGQLLFFQAKSNILAAAPNPSPGLQAALQPGLQRPFVIQNLRTPPQYPPQYRPQYAVPQLPSLFAPQPANTPVSEPATEPAPTPAPEAEPEDEHEDQPEDEPRDEPSPHGVAKSKAKVQFWRKKQRGRLSDGFPLVEMNERQELVESNRHSPILDRDLPSSNLGRSTTGHLDVLYAPIRDPEACFNARPTIMPPPPSPRPLNNLYTPPIEDHVNEEDLQADRNGHSMKWEESPPPFWSIQPLGYYQRRGRSRSPGIQEEGRGVRHFRPRNRDRRHNPFSQSQPHPPTRDFSGAKIQPRTPRRLLTLPQASNNPALSSKTVGVTATHTSLRRHHALAQKRPLVKGVAHQAPVVAANQIQSYSRSNVRQGLASLESLHIVENMGLPAADTERREIEAAVRQLINEEEPFVSDCLLPGTVTTQRHDTHEQLATHTDLSQSLLGPDVSLQQNTASAPSQSLHATSPLHQAPTKEEEQHRRDQWCLRWHQLGHSAKATCLRSGLARAVPKAEYDWSPYYRSEAAVQDPKTVLEAISVSHRLRLRLNQFDAFIEERDSLLLEVDRYLEHRVSTPCYEAWKECLARCNQEVRLYLHRLAHTISDMQYHVILKALFQVAKTSNHIATFCRQEHLTQLSVEEVVEMIDCTKAHHGMVAISGKSYRMSLHILNSKRQEYQSRYTVAMHRIDEVLRRSREAQWTKKIQQSFASLSL